MSSESVLQSLVGIGVVGCGYWGPNLIRNFCALPGCSLRKFCDTDPARLHHVRRLHPEIDGVTDFRAVLDDPTIDAVAISTGSHLHFELAKAALLAGKHTLVEKPMAHSSGECRQLNELANRLGLTLMVGHTFLFSPAVRKIKAIIDSGEIGEVRYIAARRLNLGLFRRDLNVTWDLAPHDLSVLLYLLQEKPISVNCTGSAYVTSGIEDVTCMSLKFSDDKSALIHSSWLDPRKVREMIVVGSRRMIVYDDLEPQEKIKIFDARIDAPPHYDTYAEFHFSYHYGDVHIPYIKQEEPLKSECQHFVDCIRTGATPLTSGLQGQVVVEILEAATISLKSGGDAVNIRTEAGVSADGQDPQPSTASKTVAA